MDDALSRSLYFVGRKIKMWRKMIREKNRQKLEEKGIGMDYFRLREQIEEEMAQVEEEIRRQRERRMSTRRRKRPRLI